MSPIKVKEQFQFKLHSIRVRSVVPSFIFMCIYLILKLLAVKFPSMLLPVYLRVWRITLYVKLTESIRPLVFKINIYLA